MGGLLLSGPAGSGKTQEARRLLEDHQGAAVVVDFSVIYASLTLLQRNEAGRYPERGPELAHVAPLAELLRRNAIDAAVERDIYVVATNSDGSPARRNLLLQALGPGAQERILDPGEGVVRQRLAVNGQVSQQCTEAIRRWYGRLSVV